MTQAHSTINVNISRCLLITRVIALALSHAMHVTVIPVSRPRALYARIHSSATYHVELLYSFNCVRFLCKDLHESCPLFDPRTTGASGCDSLRHWWGGTCDLYQPQLELHSTEVRHEEKRFLNPL